MPEIPKQHQSEISKDLTKSGVSIVPVEELIPGIKREAPGNFVQEDNKPYSDTIIGPNEHEIEKHPELIEIFKEFSNQVIVDLGAGASAADYRIMCLAKAKGYVGVEPYNNEKLIEQLTDSNAGIYRHGDNIPLIPASVVKEDALSFLKRLPDQSVSIFSSGTNIEIIQDSSYARMVEKEIARVMHPEGAYISMDSAFTIYDDDFESEDRESVGEASFPWNFTVAKRKNT